MIPHNLTHHYLKLNNKNKRDWHCAQSQIWKHEKGSTLNSENVPEKGSTIKSVHIPGSFTIRGTCTINLSIAQIDRLHRPTVLIISVMQYSQSLFYIPST